MTLNVLPSRRKPRREIAIVLTLADQTGMSGCMGEANQFTRERFVAANHRSYAKRRYRSCLGTGCWRLVYIWVRSVSRPLTGPHVEEWLQSFQRYDPSGNAVLAKDYAELLDRYDSHLDRYYCRLPQLC